MSPTPTTNAEPAPVDDRPTFGQWYAEHLKLEQAVRDHLATFGQIKDVRPNHFYHKPGARTGFSLGKDGRFGVEQKYAPDGVPLP